MSSKASTFAQNTLCLQSLGEQVNNEALLYNLCLVSRLFHLEFTPFLYRHVAPRVGRSWSSLVSSPYLGYTRSLTVTSAAYLLQGTNYVYVMNGSVQQMLARAPRLEAFFWDDPGLLAQDTIDRLRECCRKLKRLRVDYDYHEAEDDLDAMAREVELRGGEVSDRVAQFRRSYLLHDYSAFTDLEELSLDTIYGDPHNWARQLVKVLLNSPNLRKLGLGLSAQAVSHALWENYFSHYENLFEFLCDEYASAGGAPLQVRDLRCGPGLCPTVLSSLEKLMDLAYLEDVRLENRNVARFRMLIYVYERDDESAHSGIVFDAFLSSRCPRLRRFSVSQVCTDVFEALCHASNEGLTTQLALSVDARRLSDPTALQLLRPDPDGDGPPVQLRMVTLDLMDYIQPRGKAFEQILDYFVASQSSGALEGLAMHLYDVYTEDDDSNASAANDSANTSNSYLDQHIDALLRALQSFPCLAQLVIAMSSRRLGGPHALSDESAARSVAERLVRAVPSLRYLAVGGRCWRVWRAPAWLEPLTEAREVQAVELFAHTSQRPTRRELDVLGVERGGPGWVGM